MSNHANLELIHSVLNSFEYDKFIPGIFIIYFSKVLDTYSYYIVHHAILLNKPNQWYKKYILWLVEMLLEQSRTFYFLW